VETAKSDELSSRIRSALEPLTEVRVAYLFGSHARGSARPDSDLDIAVFADTATELASGELKLRVIEALTRALGRLGERADVVDLRRVGSAVAFAAIRDGICLLSRTPGDRIKLEATVARRYDDERPYRELFRAAARAAGRRMAEGHGRS
jgi:hypothetical protein